MGKLYSSLLNDLVPQMTPSASN